jgi:pimeloyl-ACP methyl ester carboxylesterase
MDSGLTTERPAAADPTSRVLRLRERRRIGYAEFGDPHGSPVLALHGTPGSRLMFALTDQAARARGLRIVAPERPGYGLSEFRRRTSLAQIADDMTAFADALDLDRLAIIGVSGGAPFAVATASSLPERTVLLGLISPVGPIADCRDGIRMTTLHRLIFTRIGRSPPAIASFFWSLRHLVRFAPGVAYRALMQRVPRSDRVVLAHAEVKANLQAALREGLRSGIDGGRQDLRLFCDAWGLPLDDIDVPTIVWQGSDDPIVPPGAAYHLAERLPNCRLDVIQGGGHYWVFGQFERVLDVIQAALRSEATCDPS